MTKFIAEVSSNHNQDLERCFTFIEAAKKIGSDSIKFQLFKIDQLFSPEVLQKSSEHRARKKWELPESFIKPIYEKCQMEGISFSCTPFYLKAVELLEPYVEFFKIASYELTWLDLLKECAKTKKPVIISTGMANIEEIRTAVKTLEDNNCSEIIIMHCSSVYPTPTAAANLRAIDTIRNEFDCSVGWSDHTNDKHIIYRAIYKWNAEYIEFHFDIDKKGYEFSPENHCWLTNDIEEVIHNVKSLEKIDGSGLKEPNTFEIPERDWRADPLDGLRPFQVIRNQFGKEK